MIWQTDPLGPLGGFPNIKYDEQAEFPSPLRADASISWNQSFFQTTESARSTEVELVVSHEEIDWDFIRSIYGWAAVQFQTWARGSLHNHADEDVTVAIHAAGTVDLALDTAEGTKYHFGVDFYGFKRVPIIARLKPGSNTVHVRLTRDVRANGGQMPPVIEASMQATVLDGHARILENSLVISDVQHGRFVSAHASLTMFNHGTEPIFIESVLVNAPQKGAQTTKQQLWIAPGQSRPLKFQVDEIRDPEAHLVATVAFRRGSKLEEVYLPIQVASRESEEAQRITFLHPSGVVSYAVLLPPSKRVAEQHKDPLPVMVALHGSGLDVDSYQIKHSFDGAPDLPAWLLFPTGMSPWCGDDWHTWGMMDIDAALEAVPSWLEATHWKGPGVLVDRFLIAGHSNGGHGTWNYVLKRPDRIIAAAPASGYISVENYVPQSMWDDVDPAQSAVLSAAQASFRQELFLENMKGKPVLVQHGELDDNVPAYHSRLMKSSSMLRPGIDLEYAEIPTKSHWWDGAMTTQQMLSFYLEQLGPPVPHTRVPSEFSFVVADTHEFGSLHGIHVDQLMKPDTLARVSVDTRHSNSTKTWTIYTRNVRRIRFDRKHLWNGFRVVQMEAPPATFALSDIPADGCLLFDGEQWTCESVCRGRRLAEREGKQRGSMDAVLRTDGPFQIISHTTEGVEQVALQVSRNLLQYFGADSMLGNKDDYASAVKAGGNVISICSPESPPPALLEDFPVSIERGVVRVRVNGQGGSKQVVRNASGAIFLRPLEDERLELVLWGADEHGLRRAARLVPTLTGGGQPDFVIFEYDGFTGTHEKVAAMGFFDFAWNVSAASYVP